MTPLGWVRLVCSLAGVTGICLAEISHFQSSGIAHNTPTPLAGSCGREPLDIVAPFAPSLDPLSSLSTEVTWKSYLEFPKILS